MDVLRHEMHHKDHWDKIKSIALTSEKSNAIVKAELAQIREVMLRISLCQIRFMQIKSWDGMRQLNCKRTNR